MSIKKVVITKGTYLDRELRLLVSFDKKDKALDVINLDLTKVGICCKATVEKVLNDIEACIVKLDTGDKGFIENKKLKPEEFLVRHSEKKPVCQADEFYVQISQDKTFTKPYSCNFIGLEPERPCKDFWRYFVDKYCHEDVEIISDLPEVIESDIEVRGYEDSDMSLWALYDLTKILDSIISTKVDLPKGGNILIEKTEAMYVIDINSGKNYGKTGLMETNKIAAVEIARQLRLRNISGMILIDFLKVSKEEEKELIALFKEAIKEDYAQVKVFDITKLGLMEVTRSRVFSPILMAL